jgi:two-component system, chemotaxis family, protein-glutamate methylesterase/glutaminase
VQDPEEALFPGMPNSVLNNLQADYVVTVDEMGYILADKLSGREECAPADAPADVRTEAEITRRMSSEITALEELGEIVPLTCPDCGGVLTGIDDDDVTRFRCYTGHTFTAEALLREQMKKTEETLWVAIRMMEERKNLLRSMARKAAESGTSENDTRTERWTSLEVHIERLKDMLRNLTGSTEN